MADQPRSLEDIEKHLGTAGGLTGGEPQRILRELAQHMIRQQKELDDLKHGGSISGDGTPIVRDPDGKVYL